MVSSNRTSREQIPQNEIGSLGLAFFFRRSNQEVEISGEAALKTFVTQLIRQMPQLLPVLSRQHELFSAKGDFEWSWGRVSDVLNDMLEQIPVDSRVYIILDAIDECEAESRALILDWVYVLVNVNADSTFSTSSQLVVKVLITSRPEIDLTDQLSGSLTLAIENADTANDIEGLIRTQVKGLAQRRRLGSDITQTIVQFLEKNAHGMFLRVVLIMQELERRDEGLSDEALASKLSRIPLTLVDTYKVIIHNTPPMREQDLWRTIRWLLFGSRSLTLVELEEGLCLETGISSWHDFVGDLKFLCGSLVRLDGPLEEVSFVHQTAGSFLENYTKNSSAAHTGGLAMNAHAANEHLATICVQYMSRGELFKELKVRLGE